MWQEMSLIAFVLGAQQIELTPPKGTADEPAAASQVAPEPAPSQTGHDLANLPSELLSFSNGQWLEAWLATVEKINGDAIAQPPSGVKKVAKSDARLRGNAAVPEPEIGRAKRRLTGSEVAQEIFAWVIALAYLAATCAGH